MIPVRHLSTDAMLPQILDLIRNSFAYMDTRIDPPSSVHKLRIDDIAEQCKSGEVWSIGDPPQACMLLKLKAESLYIGKVAVAEEQRGKGFARQLIALAQERARVLDLPFLELETRIELVENHAIFTKLGFKKTRTVAHMDYARPTYIVMRKRVSPV